jgi:PAS domain S-box-containing protein
MGTGWMSETYGKALLLAVGYALLAQISPLLYESEAGVPYFWLANSLVLAFLCWSPARQWPLLLVVSVAMEIAVDRYDNVPWGATTGFAFANALEAGVAAWLARRFIGDPLHLHSFKNLFRSVLLVVVIAPALSAWPGAAAMIHRELATNYFAAWMVWWRGDALGMLLFAPALLSLVELRTLDLTSTPPRKILEALVLAVGVVFAAASVLRTDVAVGREVANLPYVIFPFLVWAGLRFGLAAAAWITLIIAIATVWDVEPGVGPYAVAGNIARDHAIAIQAFLAIIAVTGLVLAVDVVERAQAQELLLQSEERLRTIGDNLPVLIGYFDQDQRFRLGNRAYEDWWGAPRETRYGRTLLETDGEQAWNDVRSHVQRVRAGERVTFDRDMRSSGVDKDLEVTYIPRLDRRGEVIGHYVLGVDVTERKHATRVMKELNDNLERRVEERTRDLFAANQELEAFAYTVAHDLRAPTRHIVGFCEMLRQHAGATLDEEARRLLDIIDRAATRQARLVEDLLQYTRVGQQQVQLQPLDAGALIEEVRDQLVAQDSSAARVEWAIDDFPQLLGDATLLRQTLLNLLGNAVKFSRGAQQPRIEIQATEKEPELAVISIRDNGVGFDMRYQEKLFQVFQRLHAEREFPGTGIGLAIVRRAIEKQGGSVWAEGRLGKGATFSFTLKQIKAHQ